MSGDAVLSYLQQAVQTGRLSTRLEPVELEEPEPHGEESKAETFRASAVHEAAIEQELQSAAAALRAKTNGHPLHVIYATSALVLAGGKVMRWTSNNSLAI